MCRVASIPGSDERRSSSTSIPDSVIVAQVYASFTLAETLALASLTVFPTEFDVRAGAAVAAIAEDELAASLKGFVARGVLSAISLAQPPLFQFAGGARDLLTRLPIAQEAICAARARHDEYFLARLTDRQEDTRLALVNAPYREFEKTNLELAAKRRISRLVGLPVGSTGQPENLTQRQWEVAQLVSTGRTNFQIAQAMGISEWTVVNHLRIVMRRLGCSSRVDVARAVLS